MLKLFFIFLLILIVLPIVRSCYLFRKTVVLEKESVPFSRKIPDAPMKILVLGDSTAVGTGAPSAALSTAGRLGALYPEASILNLAVNGLKIEGLLTILATLDAKEHFDLVLIQIGANDIIRLTSLRHIDQEISKVLKRAQAFGGKVIVLHSGNIGDTLFFPWYVRPLLSRRSFKVKEIYQKETALYGAGYVDLIDAPSDKMMKEDPEKYYAADYLHLTGTGYGLWFDEIKKQIDK